jgi:type II secretory pathway component PulK
MWLLVLMMAILAVGAQNSRLDTRTSLSSVEKIRGRWLCRAGAETALAYLKDDLKDVDSLLDEWSISNDDLQEVQLTNGAYTVMITDECSKLNLNTATANQLLYLDTQGMNETIADSILDWRDQDEDVGTNGAESGYYLNLVPGYSCRNGNFRTPQEILRVRGVTEDLFFGGGNRVYGKGGWSRYLSCSSAVNNVTAAGEARVNVNSASESDLTGKLSITSSQAQYIVQNRPFQNLAGLLGITVSSSASQNSGNGTQNSSQMNQNSPQSFNIPIQATFPIQWPQFSTVAAQLAGEAQGPPPPPPGGAAQGQGGRGGPRGEGSNQAGGRGGRAGRQGQQAGQGEGGRGGPGGGRGGQGGGPGGGRGGRGRGGFGGQAGGRGTGQGRVRGGITGGGRQQGASQAQPLDWTTFSRIFDQITLTDNTTITGVININTVSLEVLRAFLEGNDDLAGKLIAYRESMGGEITNVCDLINVQGMTQQILAKYLDQLCVRSSVFSIRVMAKSSACGVQYFMEEIVNRDREGREVLYKLEGVGS